MEISPANTDAVRGFAIDDIHRHAHKRARRLMTALTVGYWLDVCPNAAFWEMRDEQRNVTSISSSLKGTGRLRDVLLVFSRSLLLCLLSFGRILFLHCCRLLI